MPNARRPIILHAQGHRDLAGRTQGQGSSRKGLARTGCRSTEPDHDGHNQGIQERSIANSITQDMDAYTPARNAGVFFAWILAAISRHCDGLIARLLCIQQNIYFDTRLVVKLVTALLCVFHFLRITHVEPGI